MVDVYGRTSLWDCTSNSCHGTSDFNRSTNIMMWFAIGTAIILGGGIMAFALFVHPTQEDYDRYGPSYMMRKKK